MSYTVREVAAMLGLTPAQIRAFATEGFLSPERGTRGELRFGFHDLILLRTAGELSSAHIPQRKVRRVLQRLRDQLPKGASLTGVRIAADGDRVVVRDGGSIWNPESGQSLFDFAVAELMEKATPFDRRPNISEARTADEWYDVGCDAEANSAEDAQRAYERALELEADHADAHVNLGRILHEQGAPAAAEEHYRRALSIDPEHETAAFNLGVALEDLGKMAGAIDAYKRAILIDPDSADAHYNLAGIYERRGDKAAALRYLKAYAKLKKG
jgi:tetratricopeptide (TPR) repeat protein